MNNNLFAFMKAFDDDSLSDGAWWMMLEQGVNAWNEQNGSTLDPHDTVLQYSKECSKRYVANNTKKSSA